MKENLVFDAGLLSLHFVSDPRVKRYFDEIENNVKQGSIAAINLSEFYYKTCQKLGKSTADIRYYQVRNTKLTVVETDAELARNAGLEKCRQQADLSLADCYALAAAKRLKATLLTTDSELSKVKDVRTMLFSP
ncbi:type II toxin-antitoxin system VapC family toxin [Candidatus Bathyarchaeota archaeon]|nr:MAG: type II toxin-antitoxin system VapC family toxin [Candidatus Bathyarchaeota archaeon]